MRDELKARIAQINAGTAPAGYKKTKVGIVPEEWEIVQLGALCNITTGKLDANAMVENGQYKFFTCSHDEYQIDTYAFDGEAILIAGNGDVGYTRYYSGKFNAYQRTYVLMYFKGIIPYLKTSIDLLLPRKIQAELSGSAMPYITLNTLTSLRLPFPAIEEQKSIAEILTAQDAVIALMQKQIELLQKQKKAFLQKMFPKKGSTVPEIRFAGFTDAWEQYHLGDLYIERNEKGNDSLPILSVSIHTGVSDGELDTDALGKIVRRSEDRSTYKHVFCGDLVFNMMRAWQGAIGVVKREGMVSPAYISAIPNEKVYPPFMNYLLRRKAAVDQINDLSYGVTDFRKRLYWKSFIRVSCQLPSLQEQKMITELFESLDALIDQHQRKLELEQQKKKALMQLLLTGKVRVKT